MRKRCGCLSATHLDDSFCRACGYMASIPKLPPTVAILIAESARAIADAQRERALYRLQFDHCRLAEVRTDRFYDSGRGYSLASISNIIV